MIHQMAKGMTSVFIRFGECDESNADIYVYACEAIISTVANVLIGLIISLIFGHMAGGLIYIVAFMLLRRHVGGHHAKTHMRCIFSFCVMFTFSLILVSVIATFQVSSMVSIAVATLSCICIFLLPPVENENKPISVEQLTILKRRGYFLSFALWSFCVFSAYFLSPQISLALSLSMLSVLGSMTYALLSSLYQKKRKCSCNEGI